MRANSLRQGCIKCIHAETRVSEQIEIFQHIPEHLQNQLGIVPLVRAKINPIPNFFFLLRIQITSECYLNFLSLLWKLGSKEKDIVLEFRRLLELVMVRSSWEEICENIRSIWGCILPIEVLNQISLVFRFNLGPLHLLDSSLRTSWP